MVSRGFDDEGLEWESLVEIEGLLGGLGGVMMEEQLTVSSVLFIS